MPNGRTQNYYRLLGLDSAPSLEQLKCAHRDMAQVWHPDRFTSNPRLQKMAQEKLREINEAYEALQSMPAPAASPQVDPAAMASPPTVCVSSPARNWKYLGAQGIAVAAAIFALIMSGRGIYRIVTAKPEPEPAAAAIVETEVPDAPPVPRASARAARTAVIETRIANGDEITEPRGRSGVGRVSISNQTDQDALASLLDGSTGTILRTVYVSAGMQAGIAGIGPGIYRLKLDSGSDWSSRARRFTRNRTIPRSLGPFAFTQVQTSGQVRGDEYSIVLHHDATVGSGMSHAGM